LWDRNSLSFANVAQVLGRRAHVLARVRKNLPTEPAEALPDGSYLAKVYKTAHDRQADRVVVVRVIAYTLGDPNRPGRDEAHRLLTTLLDAEAHPAVGLVELYHQRWEEETCQADYPSRRRWGGARRIGYHRRNGVARVGRVVPVVGEPRLDRLPQGFKRRGRDSLTARLLPVPTRGNLEDSKHFRLARQTRIRP
jgi:hypothetical protein